VSASASVAWLVGASAVLLAAHLFSDLLARLASTQDDPKWSEVTSIGHEDVSVAYGGLGAAVIMGVAAVARLNGERALHFVVGGRTGRARRPVFLRSVTPPSGAAPVDDRRRSRVRRGHRLPREHSLKTLAAPIRRSRGR
jgi:hypothetical protein